MCTRKRWGLNATSGVQVAAVPLISIRICRSALAVAIIVLLPLLDLPIGSLPDGRLVLLASSIKTHGIFLLLNSNFSHFIKLT